MEFFLWFIVSFVESLNNISFTKYLLNFEYRKYKSKSALLSGGRELNLRKVLKDDRGVGRIREVWEG